MLSPPHPRGPNAALGPSGVSDDRDAPCLAHFAALDAPAQQDNGGLR